MVGRHPSLRRLYTLSSASSVSMSENDCVPLAHVFLPLLFRHFDVFFSALAVFLPNLWAAFGFFLSNFVLFLYRLTGQHSKGFCLHVPPKGCTASRDLHTRRREFHSFIYPGAKCSTEPSAKT